MAQKEKESLVNNVDTSPETIAKEWRQIAIDENLEFFGDQAKNDSEIPENETLNISEDDRRGAAQIISGALNYAFIYGFGLFAPAWRMTQGECQKLSEAWSKVLAKYTPARYLKFIPSMGGEGECVECDAVLVTAQIYLAHIDEQEPQPEEIHNQPEKNQDDFTPMQSKSELRMAGEV